MFEPFINTSIIKRAIDKGLVSIDTVDIRDFTEDKHRRVDFPPYGGGNGMVMSCEPLSAAIDYSLDKLKEENKEISIIFLSPRGKLLNYNLSKELAFEDKNYLLICGHYEGIDERIIEEYNITEISIGDYVLTGGEIASQVLMDSVIRLIPGVLTEGSLNEESHTNKLLEYPQYTKPAVFRGREVPEVLLSGHHKNICEYRHKESIKITLKNRPDLLQEDKES
jgi:tRNA (guanine37-N1)-methyltransferase